MKPELEIILEKSLQIEKDYRNKGYIMYMSPEQSTKKNTPNIKYRISTAKRKESWFYHISVNITLKKTLPHKLKRIVHISIRKGHGVLDLPYPDEKHA